MYLFGFIGNPFCHILYRLQKNAYKNLWIKWKISNSKGSISSILPVLNMLVTFMLQDRGPYNSLMGAAYLSAFRRLGNSILTLFLIAYPFSNKHRRFFCFIVDAPATTVQIHAKRDISISFSCSVYSVWFIVHYKPTSIDTREHGFAPPI